MKMLFTLTNGFVVQLKYASKGEIIQILGKDNVVIFSKVERCLSSK